MLSPLPVGIFRAGWVRLIYAQLPCRRLMIQRPHKPPPSFFKRIDPRTIKPLDIPLIIESIKKTRRLAVVDTGWKTGGVAGEIIASVTEKGFRYLKQAPLRITLPDVPAPMAKTLEEEYYRPLSVQSIVATIETMVRKNKK